LHPWQFELVGHAARDSNGCTVHPGEKQVETVVTGGRGARSSEVQRELRGSVWQYTPMHRGRQLLGALGNLPQHKVLEAKPKHGRRLPRIRSVAGLRLTMLAKHAECFDTATECLAVGPAQETQPRQPYSQAGALIRRIPAIQPGPAPGTHQQTPHRRTRGPALERLPLPAHDSQGSQAERGPDSQLLISFGETDGLVDPVGTRRAERQHVPRKAADLSSRLMKNRVELAQCREL